MIIYDGVLSSSPYSADITLELYNQRDPRAALGNHYTKRFEHRASLCKVQCTSTCQPTKIAITEYFAADCEWHSPITKINISPSTHPDIRSHGDGPRW